MKTILKLFIVFVLILITNGCANFFITTEPTEPGTIRIGTQTWTVKNLDVVTFRNGDSIPQAKTIKEWDAANNKKEAAWCYYRNDTLNINKYGKYYNWYAVNDARGLAPTGWHVPRLYEWEILADYLGGFRVAGIKMKSSSGWGSLDSGNGTNSSGFNGLPGGSGFGHLAGYQGHWWCASEYSTNSATSFSLGASNSFLEGGPSFKFIAISVRCVKD